MEAIHVTPENQLDDASGIEEHQEHDPEYRSGYVAVIGRPNAGKSTLFNRLLGQKIAITSPKPQTTRDQILGILTEPGVQILFLDTPGIHKPKHKLGEYMVAVAAATIHDADLVLWLVDVNTPPKEEDHHISAMLHEFHQHRALPPLLLGANQIDQWHGNAINFAERLHEYKMLLPKREDAAQETAVCVFSGLTGEGVADLVATLRTQLPLGPPYYPDDQVTDVEMRFIAAELIREQILHLLEQEVPHSIAVEVDEFSERSPELTYISAVIYVERDSQKAIVLGEGGRMIKQIGQRARPQIEELVGTRVYLELWVKVWERWRRREGLLRQLGYAIEQ